jgi:hypothetical protein
LSILKIEMNLEPGYRRIMIQAGLEKIDFSIKSSIVDKGINIPEKLPA